MRSDASRSIACERFRIPCNREICARLPWTPLISLAEPLMVMPDADEINSDTLQGEDCAGTFADKMIVRTKNRDGRVHHPTHPHLFLQRLFLPSRSPYSLEVHRGPSRQT